MVTTPRLWSFVPWWESCTTPSNTLINFAECKLTYNMDLYTNFASLTGYTVTQAEAFVDATDTAINFDGTLLAYFCDLSNNYGELIDNGYITTPGTIHHVCIGVPDGSYEIADVTDMFVKNALDTTPSQNLITNSVVDSPAYVEKNCYDVDTSDTNVCVVSFILMADFYDFNQLTLTGTGTVLLEFGDAPAGRRELVRLRMRDGRSLAQEEALEDKVGQVMIKPLHMSVEPIEPAVRKTSNGIGINIPIAVTVMAAMLALFSFVIFKFFARRKQMKKMDLVYEKLSGETRKDEIECDGIGGDFSSLMAETLDMTMPQTGQPLSAEQFRRPRLSTLRAEDMDACCAIDSSSSHSDSYTSTP